MEPQKADTARPPEPHAGAKTGDGPPRRSRLGDSFHFLAAAAAQKMGSPWAFVAALTLIIGWALTGPLCDFNDTWQLVINTTTTVITFLMVFLIQSSQNRDARALHLKLDELIRTSRARNVFADLENASEEELDRFHEEFRQLHKTGMPPAEAVREAGQRARRSRAHGHPKK